MYCNQKFNVICCLPAVDCRVTWPDVTSSIRRPVSVDVITDGSDSVSPVRRPTGTQYLSDVTLSTPPGPGLRLPEDVTSRPPCCVASRLLPVVDEEDATRSSGTSPPQRSHPISISSHSSSRTLGDATDLEVSLPSTSFPRLRHVTGSDLAAWCPATLRALTAALHGRTVTGANMPPRAVVSPDTFLPLFRAPPGWPQPDLPRRITAEDAAQLTTPRRTRRSTGLEVDDGIPALPLFPAEPRPYLHRRMPPAEDTSEHVRVLRREQWRTVNGRTADISLFDTHSGIRTLSHVSRSDPSSSAAVSCWSSLPLTAQPRHSFRLRHHPAATLIDLPNQRHHPHHRHHSYTGARQ